MQDLDQTSAYGTRVGDRLRQAREAQGMTLEDVATKTRIPIRHLRNIEDGNWQELPAVTYTVGFARSYANAVGLDGPTVGREVREEVGDTSRGPTVSPEIYAPPDPARVPSRSLAWVAGILLVVLIAAWLLVIRPYLTRSDETAAPAPAEPAEQSAEPAAAQPAAPPPSAAGQPVTLVATGDVWMNVTDRASNRRLFYNTMRAGDRFQVPSDAAQPVVQTSNPQNLRVMVGDQDRGPLGAGYGSIERSLRPEDLAGQGGQPGGAPAPAQR